MRSFRLVKARYADEVLSGMGASFRLGARWNAPGNRAIYSSENRALAVLESLAHVPRLHGLPPHVMCELEIPERLLERRLDAPEASDVAAAAEYGSRWFLEMRSVAIVVPSVIVPEEANIVLNAAHPEIGKVRLVGKVGYPVDARLSGLLGKTALLGKNRIAPVRRA